MNQETILEQFKARAATASPLGGSIKFVIDDNPIFIDGSGDTNEVLAEDKEADCTISASSEVMQKIQNGDLNATMAFMTGKIKISGDMGLAMKVQSLVG